MDVVEYQQHIPNFLFATGIENSYPTILTEKSKVCRIDEMEKTLHYQKWKEDFRLVSELGIKFLRYGPPYHRSHLGLGKYDFNFSDETFNELKNLEITPIADLCHFGVPDWIENFQNPDFPQLFSEYAETFAKRYPWVRFYTPINEIFVTARFSAKLGMWNERLTSDLGFITALKHLVKANILAQQAILNVNPTAIFIQSESTEHYHPVSQQAEDMAFFLNQCRFLPFDLSYGNDLKASVYQYLLDNGMSKEEYFWCMQNGRKLKSHSIMGNDYYASNEQLVHPDGRTEPSGEILGYYVITKQYFDRYHLPVMHTETNSRNTNEEPTIWLRKEWSNMLRLKQDGVPIIGFTWYSLIDQIDWDSLLVKDQGNVNQVGLFDLQRKIRPVGEMYKRLIKQWNHLLPTESFSLCEPSTYSWIAK
jgi:beta-glucosidase/6-phospho-beta-glucosidase/beta-galactosidase